MEGKRGGMLSNGQFIPVSVAIARSKTAIVETVKKTGK